MNRVHSHQQGRVPFSWENKPGVSKEVAAAHPQQDDYHDFGQQSSADKPRLPPPPCPAAEIANSNKAHHSFHPDLHIPLPPRAFQPPSLRSSSKRGLGKKNDDDPFMIAIKECTRTSAAGAGRGNPSTRVLIRSDSGTFGSKNNNRSSLFSSCKNSCNVIDDSVVKVPQNPALKSQSGRLLISAVKDI